MSEDNNKSSGRIMRPCDIPIYGFPEQKRSPAVDVEPGVLQSYINTVRTGLRDVITPIKQYEERAKQFIDTGVAHSQATLNQENIQRFHAQLQEDRTLQIGFIAGGGLLGLLVGALRGRFFKRMFYTTLGAGGAAAICFPKETKYMGQQIVVEGKEYSQIAWNFINGASPVESAKEAPVKSSPPAAAPSSSPSKEEKSKPEVDHGMSKKEDRDLYTTRGN